MLLRKKKKCKEIQAKDEEVRKLWREVMIPSAIKAARND